MRRGAITVSERRWTLVRVWCDAYLSLLRGVLVAFRVNANVLEAVHRPTERGAVQLGESSPLHLVPDHGDARGPPAGVLVEARD